MDEGSLRSIRSHQERTSSEFREGCQTSCTSNPTVHVVEATDLEQNVNEWYPGGVT